MPGSPGAELLRRWALLSVVSVGLLVVIGVSGPNASVPPIGLGGLPVLFGWGWPSGLVTGLGWAAALVGALAVWTGLRALRAGAVVPTRWLTRGVSAVMVAGLISPPSGSADHLSYLAYGRIAALGGNPYAVTPAAWGPDPVVSGVQPPWTRTTSVYGPVGTALQALAAWAGAGSLHASVFWWQVLSVAGYLLLAWGLLRLVGAHPAARSRVTVLVIANPLLIGAEVLGAHIDLLAMAAAVWALVAFRGRRWGALASGALVGVAASIKLPYALLAPALLVALLAVPSRTSGMTQPPAAQRFRTVAGGVVGALIVVVPGYWWAGRHALDQTRIASRYTSLSSPWRAVANLASLLGPAGRTVALATVPVVAALMALVWWRAVRGRESLVVHPRTALAARWFGVFGAGWLLAAPYVLPWYDVLIWVPLALLAAPPVSFARRRWAATVPVVLRSVEGLILLRTAALVVGYVPGRIDAMSGPVNGVTLVVRSVFTPLTLLVVGIGLVLAARRSGDGTAPSSRTTLPSRTASSSSTASSSTARSDIGRSETAPSSDFMTSPRAES